MFVTFARSISSKVRTIEQICLVHHWHTATYWILYNPYSSHGNCLAGRAQALGLGVPVNFRL